MGKSSKLDDVILDVTHNLTKPTRTTFALSQAATDMMAEMIEKGQYSTAKDILAAVADLLSTSVMWVKDEQANLKQPVKAETVRKSYVINSGSLKLITRRAKQLDTKRDVLLENALPLLRKMEEASRKNLYDKQKAAEQLIEDLYNRADQVISELDKSLGRNDPVYQKYIDGHILLESALQAISEGLADGEPITEDLH